MVEPDIEKRFRRNIFNRWIPYYKEKILSQYGQIIDDAEITGGMNLMLGKVIPIYEFKEQLGNHMAWGIHRMKVKDMERQLHQKCSILYAPGKVHGVLVK